MSTVALLADVPSTGHLGDSQAWRFTMAGDTVAERAGRFVDFTHQELDAGRKVIALYPAWRAEPAERALRFARGSRRTDHIAGIKLNLAPLALSLVADQLAYLSPYVPAGIVAALAEELPSQILAGAWLRTVTNLSTLPTTLKQHILSYQPKAGFLAVCAPFELVQHTKEMSIPARPPDPVKMLVSAPGKVNRTWFDGSFAPGLKAVEIHPLPEQSLSTTYWGTAKYVEFVAFSAHPQALSDTVNSLRPGVCRWCAEPVWALACPFCGEANPPAVARLHRSAPGTRPEHVPSPLPPPSEEERRRHQQEQERRRLEEEERERRRQERITARIRQREQEEEERRKRARQEEERRRLEEEKLLRAYREQQARAEADRRKRAEEERRRKEEEQHRKHAQDAPVVHVHVPPGGQSAATYAYGSPTPPVSPASGPQPAPPSASPQETAARAAQPGSGPPPGAAPPAVEYHQHHHAAPREMHQHNYYNGTQPPVPPGPPGAPAAGNGTAWPPEPALDPNDGPRHATSNRPMSQLSPPAHGAGIPDAAAGPRFRHLFQAPWVLRTRTAPYRGWQPPVEHELPPVSPDRRAAPPGGPAPRQPAAGPGPAPENQPAVPPARPESQGDDPPIFTASSQRIASRVANHRHGGSAPENPPGPTPQPALPGQGAPTKGDAPGPAPLPYRWWEHEEAVEDDTSADDETWPGAPPPPSAPADDASADDETWPGPHRSPSPPSDTEPREPVAPRHRHDHAPRNGRSGATSRGHGGAAPAEPPTSTIPDPSYEYRNGTE